MAQRHEAAAQVDNQARFTANSKAIEQRALAELQDSLFWVSQMSEGPIDRHLLRQAVSEGARSVLHKLLNAFTSLSAHSYRPILCYRRRMQK